MLVSISVLVTVDVSTADVNRQPGTMSLNWFAMEKVATLFQLFIFKIWLRKSKLMILYAHRVNI